MTGERQRESEGSWARALPLAKPVLAPASGTVCVAWQLRVVERVTGALELVHELGSSEPFELELGEENPLRVTIDPDSAVLDGAPVRHAEGTPGAQQVARQFGFERPVVVDEVVLRPGEVVDVEGELDWPERAAGPYRTADAPARMHGATLHARTQRPALGAALLPWVLITAAAVLVGMGTAVFAVSRLLSPHQPRMGGAAPHRIEVMGPERPPRPRFP